MMIIDADTHISPYREGVRIQAERLIEMMDLSGVDKALTWLQEPYMRVVEESNEYVYRSVKRYPDRLIGFGWIDPHFGRDRCMAEIGRCIEEYGVRGFKMNGCQNQFYVDDEEMALPYFEEIAKHNLVLALHVGSDAFDATSPYRVEKIARRFPQMPILVVHMGGVGTPDNTMACIEVAQRNMNITLVASHVDHMKVKKAIQVLGANRVCFGSDAPFGYVHSEKAAFEAILGDFFTPEARDLVMGGNIAKLFQIQ